MDIKKALAKCMYICSQREYCVYDIEIKLQKWEMSIIDRHAIIETLINERYIDHNRYVPAFVNDKFRFNHWGRIKIKYHLKQKRIEGDVINKFIDTIDKLAYEEVLVEEINKKRSSVKGDNAFERNQKIVKYVISKGFEPDIVFSKLNT